MTNSKAFEQTAKDDPISISMRELNSFLESPQSIGLDNLKESFRNIIQLMLELKGYETGYDLQHLVHGEHSSMAMDGLLAGDKRKKRKLQDFMDMIAEAEREMAKQFHSLFEKTASKIVAIKDALSNKIENLDVSIERKENALEEADTKAEEILIATELRNKKAERKKLKSFKTHIKQQEKELHKADNVAEVANIQKTIIEDKQAFDAGEFNPDNKKKFTPLADLGAILKNRSSQKRAPVNDPVYDIDHTGSTDTKTKTETIGTASDSSKTDNNSDEDTSGKKDGNHPPLFDNGL